MIQYNNSKVYHSLLVFAAVSLPISEFTLSLSLIFLLLNYIIEGGFKRKIIILKERKSLILFLSLYLLHLIGLSYSNDLVYGLADIKIKLPLFILPLIIGTSSSLTFGKMKTIIVFFIAALFVSSMSSIAALTGIISVQIIDIRDISILIPHIRFAILINIGIFLGAYLFFLKKDKLKKYEKSIILCCIIWLPVFLIILKSFTGLVLFFILSGIFLLYYVMKHNQSRMRFVLVGGFSLFSLSIVIYFFSVFRLFYPEKKIDYTALQKHTVSGNLYSHYINNERENGNFIWIYICRQELEEEWNKRSNIKYIHKDLKDQDLWVTLSRYMTSKGLRKDSMGISMLTNKDVINIEKGMTNFKFEQKFGIYQRFYEFVWEIDKYRKGGNPSGHSVTQRIEYLKASLLIFADYPVFGTGTGDVKNSFKHKYEEINSVLTAKWRLRAHNQYLTFILTFGIVGFLWIIFAIFYSIWLERKWNSFLFVLIFVTFAISMINEDTIETHVGASMVAFFYSLFLFGYKEIDE